MGTLMLMVGRCDWTVGGSSTRVCSGAAGSRLGHMTSPCWTSGCVRTPASCCAAMLTNTNCSFTAGSFPPANQHVSKQCQAAFLFPLPVTRLMDGRGFPVEPYERRSAIGCCDVTMRLLVWWCTAVLNIRHQYLRLDFRKKGYLNRASVSQRLPNMALTPTSN